MRRKMVNDGLLEKLKKAHARLDHIIFVQGLEIQSGLLEEMLEKCDDDYLRSVLGIQRVPENEEYLYHLIEKNFKGWLLAEVHTPFDISEEELMWSHTVFTVLRGDSLEQLVFNACLWASEKQRELAPKFEEV
jgi:hypothetical protein